MASNDQGLYEQALREHAVELGIDLDEEPEFYGIVEESLVAPLPEGWIQLKEIEGEYAGSLYYYHEATEQSQWEHPSDHYYRSQYQQEKAAKASKLKPRSGDAWGDPGTTSPLSTKKVDESHNQPSALNEEEINIMTQEIDTLKNRLKSECEESNQTHLLNKKLEKDFYHLQEKLKVYEENLEKEQELRKKADEEISSLKLELKHSKNVNVKSDEKLKRMNDKLEIEVSSLKEKLKLVQEKREKDKEFQLKRDDEMVALKSKLNQLSEEAGTEDEQHQTILKALNDQVKKYKEKVASMKIDKKKNEEIMKEMHGELKFALETGESLHAELAQAKKQTQEIEAAESLKVQESERRTRELEGQLKGSLVETKLAREAEMKAIEMHKEWKEKYLHERKLRQEMGKKLMELQGNIFVICRIRPLLKDECDSCVEVIDSEQLFVDGVAHSFNAVFGVDSSQEKVYAEVQPSALSVLEGYNVCIFAYGQTGSGKTYTMEGVPTSRGVNHRALSGLFEAAAASPDITYEFTLSMLEVYNETIKDLLGDDRSTNLDIRLGNDGSGSLSVYVEGLTECGVSSLEQVEQLMQQGFSTRTVGSNNVNEHSSRSHLVLSIKVSATRRGSRVTTHGKLNLVDLAGSERLKNTNAEGARLKEAQNINKSLSALGDVVSALGKPPRKDSHVPYRNSKLTFLLQDSLAANSRVLMFVNIGPALTSAHESQCSLKFAGRCRAVQLGAVKKTAKKKS